MDKLVRTKTACSYQRSSEEKDGKNNLVQTVEKQWCLKVC